ncbi:hypothetical protein QQS21_008636 [Conoideocrella luteorostrata]|uniref:Peptidase M43 pregnancy-associated plasma-A domain-containing protein n=1 Tax=Conoideocrella luteorostrata TaxID=1105319 RepID=A0AAJ0FR92_9HYPO|nr:hypothetical protein QQS21_008636 [Conoideocrella luteorostrata]
MLPYLFITSLVLTSSITATVTPPTNASILAEEPVEMSQPSQELVRIHEELNAEEKLVKRYSHTQWTPINVDVYLHVITKTDDTQERISDENLNQILQVLNDAFRPASISFQLKDKSRVVNADWAVGKNKIEMQRKLRKGDKSALNIYCLEKIRSNSRSALGRATFPDFMQQKDGLIKDGVLVNLRTLPGGSLRGKDSGKVCVHEVGHWFGLFHTFQGGCRGSGDGIDDTPAEKRPSRSCTPRNTCWFKSGMDPINNYMDYSPDRCRTKFTAGQYRRIRPLWKKFRAPSL